MIYLTEAEAGKVRAALEAVYRLQGARPYHSPIATALNAIPIGQAVAILSSKPTPRAMKSAEEWWNVLCKENGIKTPVDAYHCEVLRGKEMAGFIERIQTDAVASAVPAGWKPIESAPKDGIILVCNKNGTWPARWSGGPTGDGFYECGSRHQHINGVTHWQPLPAAPSGKGGSHE